MLEIILALTLCAQAPDAKELPSIDTFTRGMTRHDGLLTFWIDARSGKLWLAVPPSAVEFIHVEGLGSGVGSNDIGLDRGQTGDSRLVHFRRLGNKVLLEQRNLRYRALSPNANERRAAAESFASSVLWAGTIAAEGAGGEVFVDFSSFLLADAHEVSARLRDQGEGRFEIDKTRSAIDPSGCHAFPDNIAFQSILTYSGDNPGRELRSVAPAPRSITVVQYHGFVRLPDDGYHPRRHHPNSGYFPLVFRDLAAPLDAPLEQRLIHRHRLEKTDPRAPRSGVVKPIVYWVDRGAPVRVREALIEGASWWTRAFEAAGFESAFRVEELPDDVHPLDVRYNVIQWVHRSTRGWSYGRTISDPRTGEIIKGHVTLGSLRVRQDRLLFEGLAGTEKSGSGTPDDPVELALARIRQLSAHEVGHTLGLAHNFAASTYADRASVMDYPAPRVALRDDGTLDFSDAYGVGVGSWDVVAIRYGYSRFAPDTNEDVELTRLLREAHEAGALFLSDADARPAGAAHPLANLWDNGADPVEELERIMAVRAVALSGFGERNVRPRTPLALLHEVFVPVYLHHRYQLEAAAKVIGGVEYRYADRGDDDAAQRVVSAARQHRALRVVLDCVSPAFLDIPKDVLAILLPRPQGYGSHRELLEGHTSPIFDPLAAAATAADAALGALLQPQRCARLVDQARGAPDVDAPPSLEDVLETVRRRIFEVNERTTTRRREIATVTQSVFVRRLIDLARDARTPSRVRWRVEGALREMSARLGEKGFSGDLGAQREALAATIDRYLTRGLPPADEGLVAPEIPPGSPIGEARGCGF